MQKTQKVLEVDGFTKITRDKKERKTQKVEKEKTVDKKISNNSILGLDIE